MLIWKRAQIQGRHLSLDVYMYLSQRDVGTQSSVVCVTRECVCGILWSTAQTLITSPNKQTSS